MSIICQIPEDRRGQSLMEVLIAVAIGALFIVGAAALLATSIRESNQTLQVQTMAAMASGLAQNVQSWVNGNWNSLLALATSSANTYYLNSAASPFTAVPGTETIGVGSAAITRYFYVNSVYRDSSGNVTTTISGNYYDPSTRQITIVVQSTLVNGTIGTWATSTALSTSTKQGAVAAQNGFFYLLGGNASSGTVIIKTVENTSSTASGTVNAWKSTGPGMTIPDFRWLNAATAYNGYVYELGGRDDNGIIKSLVYYTSSTATGTLNTWQTGTSLATGTDQLATVAYNGYLYEIGGENAYNPSEVVTSSVNYAKINSDGSIGSWTATTPLPTSNVVPAAAAYGGYLYVVGGATEGNTGTSSVIYAQINNNGSLGSWTAGTPLPSSSKDAAAIVQNGYLYVVGGRDGATNATSTVLYARINSIGGSLGRWTNTTALPNAVSGGTQKAAYNGYLYAIGGGDINDVPTKTVWYAPFNTIASSTQIQTFSFLVSRNTSNAYLQNNWVGGTAVSGSVTTLTTSTFATSSNVVATTTAGQLTLTKTGLVPPTFVQSTSTLDDVGRGYGTSTFPSPVTAGDLIVATLATPQGNADFSNVYSVTDSLGNTYTLAATSTAGTAPCCNSGWLATYYAKNIMGGTDAVHFITATSSRYYFSIHEYSGLDTSNPLDVHNATGTRASGTTISTGSSTTNKANELLFSAAEDFTTNSTSSQWTVNSGWTKREALQGCCSHESTLTADQVVTSLGTYSNTFGGFPNGDIRLAEIVTFKGNSYQASGTLDSTPYDTGVAGGAQINSIFWQGTLATSTSVQFQLAVSNSSSGPWSFIGPDGTSNTYFSGSPGGSINVVSTLSRLGYTLFNGYRYFCYRVKLISDPANIYTPTVTGVTLNWSP